jgi:hypothetical protein
MARALVVWVAELILPFKLEKAAFLVDDLAESVQDVMGPYGVPVALNPTTLPLAKPRLPPGRKREIVTRRSSS